MNHEPGPPGDDLAADRTLAAAVRAGDADAFERLVRRHQRLVWHLVQRLVRDTEDTRELCQETFLRVHQRLHQWRGDSRLATWIGRVAWSLALRHLERRRIALVEPEAGDGDDAPSVLEQIASPLVLEDHVAEAQLHRRLHDAVEALPPLQRTLLTLYHFEELPIGEIGRITGLAEGTVKSHLFRSRQRLRALLAPAGGALTPPNPTGEDDA
jgi:RNA polymerase sigma factor (sigma-70 family)